MAKLRVYELAKELGVENKVVVSKAQELGIAGVKSHSNSLDPLDADQIRRAMLRSAAGEKKPQEVIRRRVDKDTGETSTVVEKRKGNVIRRRKRGAEGEEESLDTQESSVADSAEEDAYLSDQESSEAVTQEETPIIDEQELVAEGDLPSEGVQASAETAEVPQDDNLATDLRVRATTSEEAEAPEEETKRKRVGPKVLGKIELAKEPEQKPAKKKPTTARSFAEPEFSDEDEEDDDGKKHKGGGKKKKSKKREFSRTDLVDYDGMGQRRTGKTAKGKRKGGADELEDSALESTEKTVPKASKRVVKMDEVITVGELASQMSLKSGEVIQKLIELGVMATINQAIDQDTATIVAEEFGFQVESVSFDETEILLVEEEEEVEKLQFRSPVVTVMGHVDHGKTSLLDTIRKSSVAEKEQGGITQHIGAYQVTLEDGRLITFIDTPGHAAFTSMRARGAKVTDIVILVVAADDGVMPQTVEAIEHAKAAKVPIIVAVNKMDKPGINPDKVKQQLAERGLQPEDWGGDVMFYPVSALQATGIEELLEGVLLVAEVAELKANPERRAVGTIIEARQEQGRGIVATVLVQKGTLRTGEIYVTGAEFGRVRSMMNYRGETILEAGPSVPVEITGLSGVPQSGDDFVVVESESKARTVASHRAEKKKLKESRLGGGPVSLEEFARQAGKEKAAELNLIVKADVHGSLEAVRDAVEKLSGEKVKVHVVLGGVGGVSENDVQLAIASKALIVGFNVRAESRAADEAERHNVEIRFYRVIYELVDDVRNAMAGLLEPIRKEKSLGKVEVRDTFMVPKIGRIAGGYVTDGIARRGAYVRLVRDSAVVHEGKMSGLRRFKDDVKEVQSGYECGISIENYNDVKIGDVLELYEIEEIAASLDDLN